MDVKENGAITKLEKVPTIGHRHLQALLCFFLLVLGYAMRINLSVGIVAMNTPNTSSNPDVPVYNWKDQSVVLSSFYWGYIALQIFAGHFGNVYGPKWFLVATMTINSLACIATPIMSDKLGSKGAMACRVVQGLSQGFFFPSVHNILSKWVPPSERSRIGTFTYVGAPLGNVVAMPIVGLISASWAGWPASFYAIGALGVAWVVLFYLLGANSPAQCKYIGTIEKNYIQNSLGQKEEKQLVPLTPWKEIFTSLPVWAIIVASCGQSWSGTTLSTEIPTYLSKFMGFEMKNNALLSSAPYLATLLVSFIAAPISDYIINTGYVTRGSSRKIFNSIGFGVPTVCLATLSFVSKDQAIVCVSLLIISVGISACMICGHQVNHMDISPTYSGTLMGISNGPSNAFSILGPLFVQFIVGEDTSNPALWRAVFLTASSVYAASAVFYVVFARGEVQPWNEGPEIKKETLYDAKINIII